jgi:protein O-mannosyl-transferase
VLVVAAIAAAAIAAFRRGNRGFFVGISFFAGTVFPAAGFFYVYPHKFSFVADHFSYLANIGIIALIVAGLGNLTRDQKLFRIVGGVLVTAFAVLTFFQSSIYRDAASVWRDTVQKNPQSWIAHNNLGGDALQRARASWNKGDTNGAAEAFAEARHHAENALRIVPDHYNARLILANALRFEKRHSEAATHMESAVQILRAQYAKAPSKLRDLPMAGVLNDAGELHQLSGAQSAAENYYRLALTIEETHPVAHWNLALLLIRTRRDAEADFHLREVVRGLPASLVEGKRDEVLVRAFREALKAVSLSQNQHQIAALHIARYWIMPEHEDLQQNWRAIEVVKQLTLEMGSSTPREVRGLLTLLESRLRQ